MLCEGRRHRSLMFDRSQGASRVGESFLVSEERGEGEMGGKKSKGGREEKEKIIDVFSLVNYADSIKRCIIV